MQCVQWVAELVQQQDEGDDLVSALLGLLLKHSRVALFSCLLLFRFLVHLLLQQLLSLLLLSRWHLQAGGGAGASEVAC